VFPSDEEGLALHERLCRLDPLVSTEVCQAFLPGLLRYLAWKLPDVDDHLLQEAAGLALIEYLKSPDDFDPARGDLGKYLRLAAYRDALNLVRTEQPHQRGRVSFFVEFGPDGGNLIGREQEPSDRLARAEDDAALEQRLLAFEADCDPDERIVLRLMLAGKRDTASCAAALGIADRPADEQARRVKQIKDRLKKRLERRRSA
jgi:hypothetical protein